MKVFFALFMALLMTNAALAEMAITQQDAPETPEQQMLVELSARQADRIIANMLAFREDDLEPGHDAKHIDDELYDFIVSAGDGLPEPVSVVVMLPTDQFGQNSGFSDAGFDDPAAMPVDYCLNAALLTNYSANLQRDQAIYLEYNSVMQAVEAWQGKGYAFVLRTYGNGKPQILTAVALSEDSPWAAAKTTMVYFRQIAERQEALLSLLMRPFGPEEYDVIVIREEQLTN